MDVLSAFSLAGTVIQIVDASAKLLHTTWQVAKTGAPPGHDEIGKQTRQIQGLLYRLSPATDNRLLELSPEDEDLLALCYQSQTISQDLLRKLDKCSHEEGKTFFDIQYFTRAVRSQWNKDAIQDLQARLDRVNSRVNTLITLTYSQKIHGQVANLDSLLRSYIPDRTDQVDKITTTMRAVDVDDEGVDSNEFSRRLMTQAANEGISEVNVEQTVLDQLSFREIERRVAELKKRPAHKQSYLWLGEQQTDGRPCQSPANFMSWLSSSQSFYWLSGKPGSGKSTLMRHMCQHEDTVKQLKLWSQDKPLLLAAYFFWEVGKVALLRSQEGLLRTLLSELLSQRKDIIRSVYPELWPMLTSTALGSQIMLSSLSRFRISTVVSDLLGRLRTACQQIAQSGSCVCFFIDGLDEYAGRPDEIIELVDNISNLPNLKICVSSRPDVPFMHAYGQSTSKLYMEQYNLPDITTFVRQALSNSRQPVQTGDEAALKESLIKQVAEDAKGVFLWVHLVVAELKEGLRNHDTMRDLHKRLSRLPRELEPFYRHILDRVDSFYREHCATMLLVNLHSHDLLPLLTCWFITEGDDQLNGKHEIRRSDESEAQKRRQITEFRLATYCKGLLEVQSQNKVNFLHRTVREFLLPPGEAHMQLQTWRTKIADLDVLICKALLAEMRCSSDILGLAQGEALVPLFNKHCVQLLQQPCGPNALGMELKHAKEAIQKRHDQYDPKLPSVIFVPADEEAAVAQAAQRQRDGNLKGEYSHKSKVFRIFGKRMSRNI